jgi:putative hydrolase of HD superfamily
MTSPAESSAAPPTDPEGVVQRQLDAYNSRDLETIVATYAENAEQFEHPSTLLARGSVQLRERFAARFKEPHLHAQLIKRMVMGNIVIDQEKVARSFPEGPGQIDLVAIYDVRHGRIAKAWFIPGSKTLEAKS